MISKDVKLSLFKDLTSDLSFWGKFADFDKTLLFLERIWPLRTMPSEDPRFTNAFDDTYQHIVNNNDWDSDYLFLRRFKLLDGDEKFYTLFLETIVHPETRFSIAEILEYVTKINDALQQEQVKLVVSDYFEELPVYKLKSRAAYIDLPNSIIPNRIPFFVSNESPDQFPCFVLIPVMWDDFGSKTSLNLFYYSGSSARDIFIGKLKLMKKNVPVIWESLPGKFFELDKGYCSLGQSSNYYFRVKDIFPQNYQSILLALRDAAIFPKIAEAHENESDFRHSLIRYNEAEETYRTIRFRLEHNQSLNDYFKFSHSFKPPFADETVSLYFNFDQGGKIDRRIIAVIGKNGTGKTSMLSSLIDVFSNQTSNNNSDKKPIFGKYFTVSYSVFDRFIVPEPNAMFNYVYCGMKKPDGSLINYDEQLEIFYDAAKKIKDRDLTYQWYSILENFLTEEHLDLIFPKRSAELAYSMLTFSPANFATVKQHFSSGESILIFIVTKIVSEIRNNSLILYDEPETHLHPNAISSLMNSLFRLLTTFQSFCILATHSPLVIRELRPSDVYVLRREQSSLVINNLEKDSFGENLTVITEEIFGNRDVTKHYLSVIEKLVKEKLSFDNIMELLQHDNIPVNLNTRLYLRSLMINTNDEP